MATNDDSARLLVSIEANQRAFAKQMAAVAKQSADAAKYVENNFQRANDNVGRSFSRGANAATASTRQSAAAVSNLSFQLNDIAMGLASGTSPFTIMVQQGSQVAQVFNGSGGGLVGAVKTLGGAIGQMINPVSLASFALIGLVGYAVQYFTSVDDGVAESNEALKAHVDMIAAVAKEWGDAVPALQAYAKAAEDAKNIADLRAATDLHIDEIFKQAREQVKGMSVDITDVVSQLRAAGTSEEGILKIQEAFNKLKVAIDEGKDSTQETRELTNALIGEWLNTGVSSAQAFAGSVNEIAVAFANYAKQAAESRKQAEDAILARQNEQFHKGPLGELSPVFSNNGGFLNSDGNPLVGPRGLDPRWKVAGESAAAQMVKGFENFISKAKWDVNAYRVGFGSDTVTRANGDIEKVTKDTIVTLEDAQRDLSRRLVEFQNGIQSAIGIETWKSLNDGQQAALTSIAYNYGSLPKRIVAAIESGGGPEIVAKAIADLGADNGGINKRRRREEAETYLSGSGFSLKDVGIGGKTPADLFKGDLQQVQARIDALNAEYAAQAQLNPLVEDYGFAVEKARIQQQLLSEAQKAGLEVTPELRASIDQLAEGYARASSAAGQLKQSQEAVRQSAEDMRALGRDVLGGFIRDLQAGKSASEALAGALQKVADKLLDIGLDSIFGGSGGGGGLFGNLLGGLFGGGGFNPVGKVGLFANGVANTGGARGQPRGVVHGQEAVIPLPMGGKVPVQLQAPQVASRSATSSATQPITIKIDVSGARGNAEIQEMVSAGVRQGINQYDRTRAGQTAVQAVQSYQKRFG